MESNPEKELNSYIEQLRANKVRITDQRVAILKYFIDSRNHPTVRDIYEELKEDYPNLSVATIYNNLEIFIEHGIITDLSCSKDATHFDLSEPPHYHAVCKNCGKIVDFSLSDLEHVREQVEQLTGFEVHSHRLEVYGLCPDCQKALAKK